jgi:leucyl aminopeptidase (aminopeptidase T)
MTQMQDNRMRGARIVINEWVRVRPWDKLLIVTTMQHQDEAQALYDAAEKKVRSANILTVEDTGIHIGVFFDINENIFDPYTAIIAATDYSLVTTKATKNAIRKHKKFLSLPLSTNDGRSMLEYDFITMDTKKSRLMANIIMKYLRHSSVIHVTTPAGCDLKFYKEGRNPGFFNGVCKDGKGYSSSSIEVYIPIEETKTEGIMVLDGSLGYIGRAEEPTRLIFEKGRITDIEETPTGIRLKKYMEGYNDPNIYIGGEFGIGLNTFSHCNGNCYIEDESSFGTFHVGVGRNIALGGVTNASGHFDLVCHRPNIYADNRQIMENGKIIIPEPLPY